MGLTMGERRALAGITDGPLFRRIRKGAESLDPGDRPQARGGRRRDHRPDRRSLAPGRFSPRARGQRPGRRPAATLACSAVSVAPGAAYWGAPRSRAVRPCAVGSAAPWSRAAILAAAAPLEAGNPAPGGGGVWNYLACDMFSRMRSTRARTDKATCRPPLWRGAAQRCPDDRPHACPPPGGRDRSLRQG